MATSTVFANIKIEDAETAERFVAALEESEKEKDRKLSASSRFRRATAKARR